MYFECVLIRFHVHAFIRMYKMLNVERKFVKQEEAQQLSCAGNLEKALSY